MATPNSDTDELAKFGCRPATVLAEHRAGAAVAAGVSDEATGA